MIGSTGLAIYIAIDFYFVAFALVLLEGGSPPCEGGSPLCRIAFALVLLDGGFPSCEKDLLFEGGSPPCGGGSPS